MQRVFLVHKGLSLTAQSIKLITESVSGLGKKFKTFILVDNLADASCCVVGNDIWPKRHLLTVDETENLPIYPASSLLYAIKHKTHLQLPEDLPDEVEPSRSDGPYSRPVVSNSEGALTPQQREEIIELLEEICEVYEIRDDPFRRKGYKKALDWMKLHPDDDLLAQPFIANSVKDKVRELLSTGECQKLKSLKESDPHFGTRKELMEIHGVGAILANKLINSHGIHSIEELRKAVSLRKVALTEAQLLGLEFYEDFQKRLSRSEVEELAEAVRAAAVDHLGYNVDMVICGSYRRGAETCGDADIVLFSRDRCASLHPVVAYLKETGVIKGVLQITSDELEYIQSFQGVAKLGEDGLARRIDVKLYPEETRAFALIQWTAGEQFNRSMKIRATSMGYKLSDRGLFPSHRRTKEVIGPSVKLGTEKEVFEFLNVPYNEKYPWDQSVLGFGFQAWLSTPKRMTQDLGLRILKWTMPLGRTAVWTFDLADWGGLPPVLIFDQKPGRAVRMIARVPPTSNNYTITSYAERTCAGAHVADSHLMVSSTAIAVRQGYFKLGNIVIWSHMTPSATTGSVHLNFHNGTQSFPESWPLTQLFIEPYSPVNLKKVTRSGSLVRFSLDASATVGIVAMAALDDTGGNGAASSSFQIGSHLLEIGAIGASGLENDSSVSLDFQFSPGCMNPSVFTSVVHSPTATETKHMRFENITRDKAGNMITTINFYDSDCKPAKVGDFTNENIYSLAVLSASSCFSAKTDLYLKDAIDTPGLTTSKAGVAVLVCLLFLFFGALGGLGFFFYHRFSRTSPETANTGSDEEREDERTLVHQSASVSGTGPTPNARESIRLQPRGAIRPPKFLSS